jgi:transcriptional regulator with XRE-family HTH domain
MARSLAQAHAPAVLAVQSSDLLGRAIRAQRLSQKLRIDDAAGLCAVSSGALSRLETGKGGVQFDTVLRVLDGLGLGLALMGKATPTWLELSRTSPPLNDDKP